MPIYAYACSSCGLQKDMMRKLSDAPLTTCPECGEETLAKQLTAAGFQLKGSGYYATDFRNGNQTNRHGKNAIPDDANQHDRIPHPNPLPAGEGANESLRELHTKAPACAPCASTCPMAGDGA